jgi:hypothetical protein
VSFDSIRLSRYRIAGFKASFSQPLALKFSNFRKNEATALAWVGPPDSNLVPVRRVKSHPEREKILGGGLVVLVVCRNDGFQVFGFEHLVTIQASYVVHTVTSSHNFRAGVIAGLHRKEIIPILSISNGLSSP